MDRIDGPLAGRLLPALGGWRGLAAHIHLARRGNRPAKMRLERIAGGELKAILLMPNGRPSDMVGGVAYYSIPDTGDDDLLLAANIELAPGVGWNGIHLLVPDNVWPETLRLTLPGRQAGDFIDHPEIPADATLSAVTEIGPDNAFVRIDGVPTMPLPRARRLDVLRADATCQFLALRAGVKTAKPVAVPALSNILFAIVMLVNARLLLPFFWPHWWVSTLINAASILTCLGLIVLQVDLRMKQPLLSAKIHIFNARLEHGERMKKLSEERGF